ncbi:DUF2987 domain-containing protein [Lacimicrobium sp. SS2-24]|uniref:DUF2987 domain-containing protein n=1 Tax=Lacimicrobium sp. SS2-24 TaxID=2005569 RepID=UPI001FEFEFCE|nr:DUF2987 domain-containing protein [Lacimicrobium sp. SS2-24]
MMKWCYGVAALLSGFAGLTHADTLELDYASLYSHTRKLDSESMPDLQFAFGFAHQQESRLCRINRAFIRTPKQDIELQVSAEQRFRLPSERALKLAQAAVHIEFDDSAKYCDMSVQLETTDSQLATEYSVNTLQLLQRQYVAFFEQMGGFMSFMMPEVKGLILQFGNSPTSQIAYDGDNALPALHDEQLRLSNDWLQQQGRATLTLPEKPLRILAWLE